MVEVNCSTEATIRANGKFWFVCCALTVVYSIYNSVGRSIPSIYDLGGIFTSAINSMHWRMKGGRGESDQECAVT